MQDIKIQISTSDVKAWVWVDSIHIDRNGSKPLITDSGTEDRWRISLVVRASLADADGNIILNNGQEIIIPSPIQSPSIDVADIIHYPEVASLVANLKETALKIVNGDITRYVEVMSPNISGNGV